MRFKLNTDYTAEEREFITENNCEILSEIKLGRTDFTESETPRRMFRYGGVYCISRK